MIDLLLSDELAARIGAEGAAAYPNECCGILIGSDVGRGEAGQRVVDELQPGRNAFEADERYHRFSIDPVQQMKAERDSEAKGKVVLGFYHSHPDHPARPSEYDRQHAWPFYSYVIVSIAKGEVEDMTSWLLDEATNTFARQEIVSHKRAL